MNSIARKCLFLTVFLFCCSNRPTDGPHDLARMVDLAITEPKKVLPESSTTKQEIVTIDPGFITLVAAGLPADRQLLIAKAVIYLLRSRTIEIESWIGERVLDDYGNLVDPACSVRSMATMGIRKFGGNRPAMRRALISDFGVDAGLAIYRVSETEIARKTRKN